MIRQWVSFGIGCGLLAILAAPLLAQGGLQPRNQNTRGQQVGNQATGGQQNRQSQNKNQIAVPAKNTANPAAAIQMPPGFPLDQAHQQYVDQLLKVWENRSAKIKRYQFSFERYIYDESLCRWRDPVNKRLAACTTARGTVRYEAPDKGMYEVNRAWKFKGLKDVKNQLGQLVKEADYEEIKTENNKLQKEKWVCDGNSIFEYIYEEKRIYETKLPPEMRGTGLKNSPLPFMFGVKADEVKDRFWVKVRPQKNDQIFVLEVYPKRMEDRQNYSKIDLILSREPYLPLQLAMYSTNFHPEKNQNYVVFQFGNRKVDGAVSGAQQWMGNFVKPSLPNLLWKHVQRNPASNTAVDSAKLQKNPALNRK